MSVKRICYVGVLSALYVIFSVFLKFPLIGNTYIDLGYVALTVACSILAPMEAACTGIIGAACMDILFSPLGFSISHVVCNLIIGVLVSWSICRYDEKSYPKLLAGVWAGVFLGIAAKMLIEMALYSIPFAVKLPKSATAFFLDVIVITLSVPLAKIVKRRVKL